MKKLFILDGTGLLFRSYYGVRGMSDSNGLSTGALYGFIRSVEKLIKEFTPTHLVCVFDSPTNKESRLKIWPEYKANRDACPDDLAHQFEWVHTYCKLKGIPSLSVDGVEADDTMASVAVWGKELGAEVVMVTSDKDLCQVVQENISILQPHKNNLLIDPAKVEELYGVPPERIIDLLAMAGDTSDNVPGLPGIGAKTAAALINQLGDLDTILDNPDQVSGKKRQETIRTQRALAEVSRQLVTIDTAVPFPKEEPFFNLKEQKKPADTEIALFYKERNFRSLVEGLKEASESDDSTEHSEEKDSEQLSYTLVNDLPTLKALVATLEQHSSICFDTETTALHPLRAEIVGIGFAITPAQAWYVPCNGSVPQEKVLSTLKPLFENPAIGFYGHNIKYDAHILKTYDIAVANIDFDTMIASYILNSHSHRHSLDHLSLHYFNKTKTAITDLIGKGKKQISMSEVPLDAVCRYCCEDVDYTCRLKAVLKKEIHARELEHILTRLELPLVPALQRMERAGIYVDANFLKSLSAEFIEQLSIISSEIYDYAGEEFNINSPKQLGTVLFDNMGITPPKKTASGAYSTSAEVLEKLATEHPIAEKILDYRSLEKLRSTYTDTLIDEIHPETKRIHCTFNQSVASTGRLSSQNPNLQNIPVRTAEGRKIREAFRPEKEGWSFLSADYSQIELRLLAHMSEDPTMLAAFHNGEDIHSSTASVVFGVPLPEVTKEMRYHAKAVNFGIIYGQQAFGLSKELGISVGEASQFIKTYFEKYGKIKDFIEQCKEDARKNGRAKTLTGRERLIPDIHAKNGMLRQASERLAVNTPLQGTAADIIKMAMVDIDNTITENKLIGSMILQVHDELIFTAPDFELLHLETLVRAGMEKVMKLKVSLTVDITIGKNWKEC